MNRAFYSSTISEFLNSSDEEIIGVLVLNNQIALEQTQRDAWLEEIRILKTIRESYRMIRSDHLLSLEIVKLF